MFLHSFEVIIYRKEKKSYAKNAKKNHDIKSVHLWLINLFRELLFARTLKAL